MSEVVNIANKIKKEYAKIIEETEEEMITGKILDAINSWYWIVNEESVDFWCWSSFRSYPAPSSNVSNNWITKL